MAIPEIESHPLFSVSPDLVRITSPYDVGFHPESVLSVFDYLVIYPHHMSKSGVRGDSFVAIRFAAVDEYTVAQAKVETVYLRKVNERWEMFKLGVPISSRDFENFTGLAQGRSVEIDGRKCKRI